MSEKQVNPVRAGLDAAEKPIASNGNSATDGRYEGADRSSQSFLRRHRMPIFLAILAVCLYAGSILYILYGRGQAG